MLQLLTQDVWSSCQGTERWKSTFFSRYSHLPTPHSPIVPGGIGRAHLLTHWSPSYVGQALRSILSLEEKVWLPETGIRCPSGKGIAAKLALKVNTVSRGNALISNKTMPLDL